MITWFAENLWALWLIVAILLAIIEIFSLDFFFLMMALAALTTLASAPLTDSITVQVIIFAAVSILLLLMLRPPLIRKLHQSSPNIAMNADGLVGKTALVTESVSAQSGLATIAGDTWTVRPEDHQAIIPAGTEARVTRIDGATAYISST